MSCFSVVQSYWQYFKVVPNATKFLYNIWAQELWSSFLGFYHFKISKNLKTVVLFKASYFYFVVIQSVLGIGLKFCTLLSPLVLGSISTACIGIKSLQDTTLRFPKLRDLQRTKSPYSRFDCILRYFCLMPSVPRHLKRFFANANHISTALRTKTDTLGWLRIS